MYSYSLYQTDIGGIKSSVPEMKAVELLCVLLMLSVSPCGSIEISFKYTKTSYTALDPIADLSTGISACRLCTGSSALQVPQPYW